MNMKIKRLDIFIAKQFLQLFAGTFCISQFVLMMQFLWRFVDDLIGKGLSLEVLGQVFWYMGMMLVPDALPLAVLLSALITFGNLGESSELTAIKAAGISLLQAFRSIIFLTILVAGCSFIFQNKIAPEANKKFYQLVAAMKQKNPEVEIPEGIFYDGIPGCNLYVQKKNVETGMLYGVMIYRMNETFEDAAIILADSARMQTTAEKKHLKLTLYSGEWFENMKSQQMMGNANVPYRRETFIDKVILLDFNADLEINDEVFAGDARGKSLTDIYAGLDRTVFAMDSIGRETYKDIVRQYLRKYTPEKKDTLAGEKLARMSKGFNIDTLYAHLSSDGKRAVTSQMLSEVRMEHEFLAFGALMADDGSRTIREHYLEWINKYTKALLCLVFLFIGAPLGAIIRKGGLGIPVIISVIVFLVFYILDFTGFRMARIGEWSVAFAKSLAPVVLIPTAVFFTYKANKDSMVFNIDLYRNALRRLLGMRLKRSIALKQVIIEEPDYLADKEALAKVTEDVVAYNHEHRLRMMPNIMKVFFVYKPDHEIERIVDELEAIIDDLSNTREKAIMKELQKYPVVSIKAHTRPFNRRWMNIAAFVLLPVGLLLYIRMWRFRLRLYGDLRRIHEINDNIIELIETQKAVSE